LSDRSTGFLAPTDENLVVLDSTLKVLDSKKIYLSHRSSFITNSKGSFYIGDDKPGVPFEKLYMIPNDHTLENIQGIREEGFNFFDLLSTESRIYVFGTNFFGNLEEKLFTYEVQSNSNRIQCLNRFHFSKYNAGGNTFTLQGRKAPLKLVPGTSGIVHQTESFILVK